MPATKKGRPFRVTSFSTRCCAVHPRTVQNGGAQCVRRPFGRNLRLAECLRRLPPLGRRSFAGVLWDGMVRARRFRVSLKTEEERGGGEEEENAPHRALRLRLHSWRRSTRAGRLKRRPCGDAVASRTRPSETFYLHGAPQSLIGFGTCPGKARAPAGLGPAAATTLRRVRGPGLEGAPPAPREGRGSAPARVGRHTRSARRAARPQPRRCDPVSPSRGCPSPHGINETIDSPPTSKLRFAQTQPPDSV
jgi:hypothetical protein